MPAKIRIWKLFGPQAFGIGHSSLEIAGQYITWLGGGGGWSASSDSSSVSRSSRSTSSTGVAAKVSDGTWVFANDKKQFKGDPAQTIDVPLVEENDNAFGLRSSPALGLWWRHARAGLEVGGYKGVSTDRNCNAIVALGIRAANGELYAARPAFSTFAGTNKIITFANEITQRANLLNRLWGRQGRVLREVRAPAEDARLPRANPFPDELPGLTVSLALYAGAANCARDQLKALGDMLSAALDYIEAERANTVARFMGLDDVAPRVPAVPRVQVRPSQVVPLSVLPSSSPRREAFVRVDPYPAIQAFAAWWRGK